MTKQGPKLTGELGFTLIETMVSVAIVVIVASGLAGLTSNFAQSQSKMATADVSSEFTTAFGKYLMTQEGCTSALVGKTLGAATSPAPELSISGYEGYGSMLTPGKSKLIEKGSEVERGLHISSVTLQEKSGLRTQRTGPAMYNHVAIVNVGLERSLDANSTDKFQYRPAKFELPVITDSPTGGRILDCRLEWDPEVACNAIDWAWDPVRKQCTPGGNQQCVYKGTYTEKHVHVYFWIYSDTVRAFYLQGTRLATPAEAGMTPSEYNPYTGGGSCPAGTTDYKTGEFRNRLLQVIKHPNGKGEAHLYLYDIYHSCMKCP